MQGSRNVFFRVGEGESDEELSLIVILLCECNNFDFLLRPHSDPYMAPEENKSNLIFRFGFFLSWRSLASCSK